jgi:aminoglycoside phosphotransferase (APT) family kinase protein
MTSLLGEVVARGTRSWIHAYGHGAVAKVPRASTPTGWIYAEAEYAEAARAVGAPVPRLLGIEHINGRAASVWERVEGTPMWQFVVDQPKLSGDLGRLLADIQCALFELVPPVTLPAQRDRLAAKIRRSAATVDASLARALDLLPVPASPPRVCHGDLHPSNVILSRQGPVIVDWFDASRGDPIADVARTSMTLLGDGGSGPRHLPGSDGRTLVALTKAYRSRLQERLELGDDLVARWEAIQAVARMAEGLPRGALLEVWMRFVDIENRARSITEAPDSQKHQVAQAAAN